MFDRVFFSVSAYSLSIFYGLSPAYKYNCIRMHNYNIANRYNTVTRVGNWYEEK